MFCFIVHSSCWLPSMLFIRRDISCLALQNMPHKKWETFLRHNSAHICYLLLHIILWRSEVFDVLKSYRICRLPTSHPGGYPAIQISHTFLFLRINIPQGSLWDLLIFVILNSIKMYASNKLTTLQNVESRNYAGTIKKTGTILE